VQSVLKGSYARQDTLNSSKSVKLVLHLIDKVIQLVVRNQTIYGVYVAYKRRIFQI